MKYMEQDAKETDFLTHFHIYNALTYFKPPLSLQADVKLEV